MGEPGMGGTGMGGTGGGGPGVGAAGVAPRVGVLGLGSMGLGMALSLLRAGFEVVGFDPVPAAAERFASGGGRLAASPAEAALGASVVVAVVVNAAQTEQVLFGEAGCAAAMPLGSVFIASATMAPQQARALAARVEVAGRLYLDAPMSGGAVRAADGDLTMLASGSPAAFAAAEGALAAMTGTLYRLGDAPGVGAAFKMVNQLLAGIHVAAAGEAMAFAARQGLDLARVYEVITRSAGSSWMFANRVPHLLAGDTTPHSAVDILVKDMGIVVDMARDLRFPVPVAGSALQMFLMSSAAGLGRLDDSTVAHLYARIAGLSLPGMDEDPPAPGE